MRHMLKALGAIPSVFILCHVIPDQGEDKLAVVLFSVLKSVRDKIKKSRNVLPGVEPGLSRPQRDVLTTRR